MPQKKSTGILLVQLTYPSSPFPGPNLPIGLGYIAEQLELNNIPYAVIDLSIDSKEDLFKQIVETSPEYVALSMMSLDINNHYELAIEIKTKFPCIKIVAGGAHISFVQEKALLECPAIDFGVVHEGEQTLIELLNGNTYQSIKGLLYRGQDGYVIFSGNRELIEKLDNLDFPRYRKFKLNHYGGTLSIASSRGCPYSCTFCGAFLSMGKKWRARSVQNVIAELEYWQQNGYTSFNFVDSNFFLSKQRVMDLCDSLSSMHLTITLTSDGMRAEDADPEMLKKLKQFGLQSVAIGIESANDDILNSIKKGETVADLELCLETLLDLGIDVVAFFIIGLPGETIQHVLNSFRFALKYPNISTTYFFNPNPLPGTELYKYAEQHHMLRATESQIFDNIGGMSNQILLETEELPISVRVKLLELSHHVSRMVELRHRLYRAGYNMAVSNRNAIEDEIWSINSLINHDVSLLNCHVNHNEKSAAEYEKIFTHLTNDEKYKLQELAKNTQGATYVELGSYLGASSCFIASGIKSAGVAAKFFCVDTWANEGMAEGSRDTYDAFLQNTVAFSDVIVPLRGKSDKVAKNFDKEIDFLFIDAGHDYENVSTDVRLWFPKLKSGALVIFHDTGWAEGVQRVVNEYVRTVAYDEGELPNMYWGRVDLNQEKKIAGGSSKLHSIYDETFYDEQKDASYKSAESVVPILLNVFKPKSVIDIGCGVGGWLHVFQRGGVTEICGYDVNELAADKYFIDKQRIRTNVDLSNSNFRIHEKTDLLICLEVAEHLPAEAADQFILNLVNASPVVVFSAALVGQTGVNHINEQPPWYWREIFNKFGYTEIDFIRPQILRNEEICWWYRQNITCFVRPDVLSSNLKLAHLATLHGQKNHVHKLTLVNEWVLMNILNGEHIATSQDNQPNEDAPFLSVIIPTRNRASLLYNTLDSLISQTYPAIRFEVIVVDNGSTDSTAEVCNHFERRIQQFKRIYDPRPGLHNGRHTGLEAANGDILVYADDDIEALPTWLEGIAESFVDLSVALVGGKILPKFECPPPEWIDLLSARTDSGWSLGWYSLLDFGDAAHEIPHEYVWGCNFSIRKDVLKKVGGFHPDSVPQELIKYRGDGETAVSFAVRDLGLKAVYNPKAAVFHVVSSNRLTINYIYQRAFNQGVSESYSQIRLNRALSSPMHYASPSDTIHETVNRGMVDGFNYHQQMVQVDRKLQEWVLRDNYFGENGVPQ